MKREYYRAARPFASRMRLVCYIKRMKKSSVCAIPQKLAAELERKFFWWEPVGSDARSDLRIVTQAMDLASFDDVRRLERTIGPSGLVDAMLSAEPGWISDRS